MGVSLREHGCRQKFYNHQITSGLYAKVRLTGWTNHTLVYLVFEFLLRNGKFLGEQTAWYWKHWLSGGGYAVSHWMGNWTGALTSFSVGRKVLYNVSNGRSRDWRLDTERNEWVNFDSGKLKGFPTGWGCLWSTFRSKWDRKSAPMVGLWHSPEVISTERVDEVNVGQALHWCCCWLPVT